MENVTLRPEQPGDYNRVEALTYRAFLNAEHADGGEALLARKLRYNAAFVPELDFVALLDGKPVGNIMYTRSKVVADDGTETPTLTFGPLSVEPALQRRGIGAALVTRTLQLAREQNHRAVIIFGHPAYYPRFGFVPAAQYGITTADGQNADYFMALPLFEGALGGVNGRFYHAPVFDSIGQAERDAFNARFAQN